MSFGDQIKHIARRDELHRAIDEAGDDGKVLLITFRDGEASEFRYLASQNVHVWEAIGLLESARDHVSLPSDFSNRRSE